MSTANDYRNFIRGVKNEKCQPYSRLDKDGLRQLAIKMGWMKYTANQRGAMSRKPQNRSRREQKEAKEVRRDTSIDEMKRQAERMKKKSDELKKKAEQASAAGRGYQKLLDEAQKISRERFLLVKKIKTLSGSIVQR